MNKMNIPAPFRKALPTPPLPEFQSAPPPPPPSSNMEYMSSSESEMESSDEVILWLFLVSCMFVLLLQGHNCKFMV